MTTTIPKKGNFWKKAAVGITLAFTLAQGALYLANRNLARQHEKDAETIAQLEQFKAVALSSGDCTKVYMNSGKLILCQFATRSLDRKKDTDHLMIYVDAKTTEGLRVDNVVSFDTHPDSRNEVDDYKTLLLEKLAKRTAGMSACDMVAQDDYMLPEFKLYKRQFLDRNGDPQDSRAKKYRQDVSREARSALDALKAKGTCPK